MKEDVRQVSIVYNGKLELEVAEIIENRTYLRKKTDKRCCLMVFIKEFTFFLVYMPLDR